jgi:hypothetical protein
VTEHAIDRPIFFVGMPRSGTTLLFEVFAARRDVAWLSQHLQRFPGAPALALVSRLADLTPRMRRSVSRSDQLRPWLEKVRVGPVEAYGFWERCCGERFLFDYLLGEQAPPDQRVCASAQVAKVLRYHGKPRFAAKVTGPGRIEYLSSIFPDARFVHVIRDGRAVVQSLLRVHFWRERDRMRKPAWRGGLTPEDLAEWERHGSSPLGLAAVQWKRVVESTRAEGAELASDRYAEVHYERFVTDPDAVLDAIAEFCDLPHSPEAQRFLRDRFTLQDMNFQWRERLESDDVVALNRLLGATLAKVGYQVEPPGLTGAVEHLSRPPFAAGDPAGQSVAIE